MATLVMMALMIAGTVAIGAYTQRRQRAEEAAARDLAARYGFLADVRSKPPPPQQFDLFRVGSSRLVSFQFWRDGEHDSVFRYRYTTGSGKNRTTHHHCCALIALPFAAPHTKVGPEGFWSGIGRAVGIRDIELESPAFNDQYRVTSDDERFAVTMLDQPMMAWLLESQASRSSIRFEFWGPWLLCVTDKMDVERMFGYLDWCQDIRRHLPTVLASLYPAS